MYLKELTINGFKSFAKKGELEFSAPITAIVGPNGSGKSNVAEAFRFVLGEQSPSKMRGKKGEDLIWSGSESSSRSNRAVVAITLNNEQKIFPLDFNEITIERAVNRDGSNEYSINGSRARLRDVQEILAAANIGSTGHHIISQGEADRILSANPRERREMIEDALGLKVYQYKKQESEKKLKKTVENIAQVESLRREVAPHLKFLEKQVKKMEKALELQEELKVFYAAYLKREDVYLTHNTERLTREKHAPEARQKELTEKLAEAKAQLAKATQDDKRDALIALERDISSVRTERQEIMRESGKLEGQISFIERSLAEAKRQSAEVVESPIPYTEFARAAESVERAVSAAAESTDVSLLQRTLRDVLGTIKTLLVREFAETKPQTEREEAELQSLQSARAAFEEKQKAIEARESELQNKYELLRTSIEEEHSLSRDAERAVFEIMNEQREIEHTLSRIASLLHTLSRDREEFTREVQEAIALIRSSAKDYQSKPVLDAHGAVVSEDEMINEDRDVQRDRRRTLEKMKIRLEELGAGEADDVLKEYKDVKERDEFLVHEVTDLTDSVAKLESLIADLTEQLNKEFVIGIEKIDAEFNRFFMLMFGGGMAKLLRVKPKVRRKSVDGEEEDTDDESEEDVEEGIEIDVKLPNKRVRGLDMLSGGERALTSIALIFAMSQVNPPLFVILDETDAALDEANSRRYGDMISELGKRSQLILITHNRETMGRAGVLYGVTMGGDGMSRLLSVKFEEALAVAK
ncbi:AAA family ATPase [Candidatus Parcubacteria bacterium]|uniref:RecF/RecN/SMC N-terminal domain-containing protein n=1 Tax=Candidatus Kaiserbacteria bacterium CG10_big_fil_rev_8_21_14_0_10_47_16 TaxID=1974608 RepID=A0A2H0UE74_9BACT|nr:AAA family ATPase [Candidatus Parcubacteria bacterium]PIR84723.1 MAG: hypothetical protein COU16_00870 [Candidatus Kaiserbacteria bacterium CG10_big_fil_rev_8_21_14_0_10_47_16]